MILAQTTGGATSDSFYYGLAPASTLVSVDKTITIAASTLYTLAGFNPKRIKDFIVFNSIYSI